MFSKHELKQEKPVEEEEEVNENHYTYRETIKKQFGSGQLDNRESNHRNRRAQKQELMLSYECWFGTNGIDLEMTPTLVLCVPKNKVKRIRYCKRSFRDF